MSSHEQNVLRERLGFFVCLFAVFFVGVFVCVGDFNRPQITYRKNTNWKIESTISYIVLFPEESSHNLLWPVSVSYDES